MFVCCLAYQEFFQEITRGPHAMQGPEGAELYGHFGMSPYELAQGVDSGWGGGSAFLKNASRRLGEPLILVCLVVGEFEIGRFG